MLYTSLFSLQELCFWPLPSAWHCRVGGICTAFVLLSVVRIRARGSEDIDLSRLLSRVFDAYGSVLVDGPEINRDS